MTECRCKRTTGSATITSTVQRAPSVLTVVLRRFDANTQKVNSHVSFEQRLLLPTTTGSMTYELYAAICHIGHSVHNGHYFTFVCKEYNLAPLQ